MADSKKLIFAAVLAAVLLAPGFAGAICPPDNLRCCEMVPLAHCPFGFLALARDMMTTQRPRAETMAAIDECKSRYCENWVDGEYRWPEPTWLTCASYCAGATIFLGFALFMWKTRGRAPVRE